VCHERCQNFVPFTLYLPSCGLAVVSSNVGGVHEVLPADILTLAPPEPQALADAVVRALTIRKLPQAVMAQHRKVAEMYSWHDVAQATAKIYDVALIQNQTQPPITWWSLISTAAVEGGVLLGWLLVLITFLAKIIVVIVTFRVSR